MSAWGSTSISGLDVRVDDRALRISASLGVATLDDEDTIFFDAVLKKAEGALAQVTARGGDSVAVAT